MSALGSLVALEDVTKEFSAPGRAEKLVILKSVSMEIASGEALAVVGPSGSGKSTFLNVVGGLDRPTSGRALLDGRDLNRLGARALAEARNRQIGFVFQAHHLLPQCTAFENVLVPTLPQGRSAAAGAEERAKRLLERVGLGGRLDHRPGQLSGGEQQRVAVARALINQPKLVLADEPTGALDRAASENLGRLLIELNQEEGATLILVTHSLELARHMKKIFELRDGTLRERKQP